LHTVYKSDGVRKNSACMRALCDNWLRITAMRQQTESSFTSTQKVAVAHCQSCPHNACFPRSTDDTFGETAKLSPIPVTARHLRV